MQVERVIDYGKREAVLLEGDRLRVVIADKGGMVPELSFPSGDGWFNTHWVPHFRATSGVPFSPVEHSGTWPVELLYELAGNFLCLPNFGGDCEAYGTPMPPHGLTANGSWSPDSWGEFAGRAVYQRSEIAPDDAYPSIPLTAVKYDVVFDDSPGHYVCLSVTNRGEQPYRLTLGWHNTLGAPFLSPGCRIDLSANRFATPPSPSEFDNTARLETGASFDDLASAPLSEGGTVDLHRVPGMIGATDFITGAIPEEAELGWSSVVNPHVGAVYLSIFPGPRTAREGEIPINFNDLWMQYGGRPFAPWGSRDGGTDYTYCLGAENATGGYANGLAWSLEHPELLGRPTTIEIAPGQTLGHVYASFALPYEGGALDGGVERVVATGSGVDVIPAGGGAAVSFDADAGFDELRDLAETMEEAR